MLHAQSPIPIYKVGILLTRNVAGQRLFFILRPKAKNAGETAPLVLPRGSRQYQDSEGNWQDARDDESALAHAAALEPLMRTLAREAEEEAGLSPILLNDLQASGVLKNLGARVFHSANKPPYPVYWFAAHLTEIQATQLTAPEDAVESRWESLASIQALAEQGDFSAAYLKILREVADL